MTTKLLLTLAESAVLSPENLTEAPRFTTLLPGGVGTVSSDRVGARPVGRFGSGAILNRSAELAELTEAAAELESDVVPTYFN